MIIIMNVYYNTVLYVRVRMGVCVREIAGARACVHMCPDTCMYDYYTCGRSVCVRTCVYVRVCTYVHAKVCAYVCVGKCAYATARV